MKTEIAVVFLVVIFSGCTSIRTGRIYQDGSGIVMEAQVADDSSGSGELRFVHFDGEKFTGNYTSIAQGVYYTTLTGIVGGQNRRASLIPSISTSSSRTQYGLASLAGDRGTSIKCVYIASLIRLFPFQANTTGVCKDSRDRMYTLHYVQGGEGGRFPDDPEYKRANLVKQEAIEPFKPPVQAQPLAVSQIPAVIESKPNVTKRVGTLRHQVRGADSGIVATFEYEDSGIASGNARVIFGNNYLLTGQYQTVKIGESFKGQVNGSLLNPDSLIGQSADGSRGFVRLTGEDGGVMECVFLLTKSPNEDRGECVDQKREQWRLNF